MMMRQEKKMNETIEDILSNLPPDSSVMSYNYDEEFIDDIRGWFHHVLEDEGSSIRKFSVEDKMVIKITNFIKEEPITNGEDYYIVMERLTNNSEQQEDKG